MKIISNEMNRSLASVSNYPAVGVASGLLRLALAIIQLAINTLFLIPSAISSVGRDDDFDSFDDTVEGITHSLGHITRALFEIGIPLSFTFLFFNDRTANNIEFVQPYSTDYAWTPIKME